MLNNHHVNYYFIPLPVICEFVSNLDPKTFRDFRIRSARVAISVEAFLNANDLNLIWRYQFECEHLYGIFQTNREKSSAHMLQAARTAQTTYLRRTTDHNYRHHIKFRTFYCESITCCRMYIWKNVRRFHLTSYVSLVVFSVSFALHITTHGLMLFCWY